MRSRREAKRSQTCGFVRGWGVVMGGSVFSEEMRLIWSCLPIALREIEKDDPRKGIFSHAFGRI